MRLSPLFVMSSLAVLATSAPAHADVTWKDGPVLVAHSVWLTQILDASVGVQVDATHPQSRVPFMGRVRLQVPRNLSVAQGATATLSLDHGLRAAVDAEHPVLVWRTNANGTTTAVLSDLPVAPAPGATSWPLVPPGAGSWSVQPGETLEVDVPLVNETNSTEPTSFDERLTAQVTVHNAVLGLSPFVSFTRCSNPPSITYDGSPVSALTPHSAALNAEVHPEGFSGTAILELGLTERYELGALAMQALDGSTDEVHVQAAATRLKGGTTYHWRVRFDVDGHEVAGDDQTFTTPEAQESLTLTATGPGSVATSPSGTTFLEGTAVTVTATPDAGSTLTGWKLDGRPLPAQSPLLVTMDGPHTLEALFGSTGAPGLPDAGTGAAHPASSVGAAQASHGCSAGASPTGLGLLALAGLLVRRRLAAR